MAAYTFFFYPPIWCRFEVKLFPIQVAKHEIRRNFSVCWSYLWCPSALSVFLEFHVKSHEHITWFSYDFTLDEIRSFIFAFPESEFLGHSCAFKVVISNLKVDSTNMFKKKIPNLIVKKTPIELFCYEWFIIRSEQSVTFKAFNCTKERPDYCMLSVLVKVVLIILYLKRIFSRWSGIASEKLIFGACLMSNFWHLTIVISKGIHIR